MALGPANQQQQPNPVICGYAFKTGFTFTAFGPAVILTNAAPGLYRFSAIVIITTTQASDAVTVNVICTDDQQAETVAILSGVSTASGNIYIVVERLF